VKPDCDNRTPISPDQVVAWSGSCRTKYVRGREASEAGVLGLALIANCNGSLLLQWEVFDGQGF